ncbi:unnamed protein product [Bathycoccus prasinos]|jgi:hypothetical protein
MTATAIAGTTTKTIKTKTARGIKKGIIDTTSAVTSDNENNNGEQFQQARKNFPRPRSGTIIDSSKTPTTQTTRIFGGSSVSGQLIFLKNDDDLDDDFEEEEEEKNTTPNKNASTLKEEKEEQEEEYSNKETATREDDGAGSSEEEEGNTIAVETDAPPREFKDNATITKSKLLSEGSEREGSQRKKRGRPRKNDVFEDVFEDERRAQEEKDRREAMRVLLEAAEKDDTDGARHIQKKAKTTTTSNGNKKTSLNNAVDVNDAHTKATNGGVDKEDEQLRGRPDITAIEKLAADALNNILPNASTSERMAHINTFMNKGASGNNGQTKASQKGQQDKQQQELNKNDKNLVAPGKDYSRLLEEKRNELSKKKPEKEKRKRDDIVEDADISVEQSTLHKTYKEALQRMREENVRKSRDQKQPSIKSKSTALNAVTAAQVKLQKKNVAAAAAAAKEASRQQHVLAQQQKQQHASFLPQTQEELKNLLFLQQIQSQVALQTQPQVNINAALLHLLLAGGQGSIPSIGGMDLNQPIQNLLAPNLLNMSAAHLSNGNGLHGGGGAGMSGTDFAVPPSRSSQKMNNSSSNKKEEGSRKGADHSSSILMPSVNATAFKKRIRVVVDELMKKIRKKIALKLALSEAGIEKELNLLESGSELHSSLCSFFELH